eukprot:2936753-Pyramimonas_sp.AAC.1
MSNLRCDGPGRSRRLTDATPRRRLRRDWLVHLPTGRFLQCRSLLGATERATTRARPTVSLTNDWRGLTAGAADPDRKG